MSNVFFKFQSNTQHDTVTFDGLQISLAELRNLILQKSKLPLCADFTLQVTNAQTNEVYAKDDELIPKNTSVIVTRVPTNKTTSGDGGGSNMDEPDNDKIAYMQKRTDSTISAAEEASIKAMMHESTNEFIDTAYAVRPRFVPSGAPPSGYICYRCRVPGHWIQACPRHPGPRFEVANRMQRPKFGHGIPASRLIPADSNTPGAVLTPMGYAVPILDAEAYAKASEKKAKTSGIDEQRVPEIIPDEFICFVCKNIMDDAVKSPCCGSNYCDKCIRDALLESEDLICPNCKEIDVSPDSLVPNMLLRSAIATFLNKTKSVMRVKATTAASSSPRLTTSASATSPSQRGVQSSQPLQTTSAAPESAAISTAAAEAPASSCVTTSVAVATTIVSATAQSEVVPAVTASSSSDLLTSQSAATVTLATSSPASSVVPPGTAEASAPVAAPYVAPIAPMYSAPYRPGVQVAPYIAMPQHYPPGMRPGFPTYPAPMVQTVFTGGLPYQPPNHLIVPIPRAKGVLTPEEFYKEKAKLLELKLQENDRKAKDLAMDEFARELMEFKKDRYRKHSRSPRSRSPRSRSPRGRSRTRSVSPRDKYRGSPRTTRSPGHYRRGDSPPSYSRSHAPYGRYGESSRSSNYYDHYDNRGDRYIHDRYVESYFREDASRPDRLSPGDYYGERRAERYGSPSHTLDRSSSERRPYSSRRNPQDNLPRSDDHHRRSDQEYVSRKPRHAEKEWSKERKLSQSEEQDRDKSKVKGDGTNVKVDGQPRADSSLENKKKNKRNKTKISDTPSDEDKSRPSHVEDGDRKKGSAEKLESRKSRKHREPHSETPLEQEAKEEKQDIYSEMQMQASEGKASEMKPVNPGAVLDCADAGSAISKKRTTVANSDDKVITKPGDSIKVEKARKKHKLSNVSSGEAIKDGEPLKKRKKEKVRKELICETSSPRAQAVTASDDRAPEAGLDSASDPSKDDFSSDLVSAEPAQLALPLSKWEMDDSGSESQQAVSKAAATVAMSDKRSSLSRKVIESAESVLRNKQVRPQIEKKTPNGRRLYPSDDTLEDDTLDSSDDRSDLRTVLQKIKKNKSGSNPKDDAEVVSRKRERSRSKVDLDPASVVDLGSAVKGKTEPTTEKVIAKGSDSEFKSTQSSESASESSSSPSRDDEKQELKSKKNKHKKHRKHGKKHRKHKKHRKSDRKERV